MCYEYLDIILYQLSDIHDVIYEQSVLESLWSCSVMGTIYVTYNLITTTIYELSVQGKEKYKSPFRERCCLPFKFIYIIRILTLQINIGILLNGPVSTHPETDTHTNHT